MFRPSRSWLDMFRPTRHKLSMFRLRSNEEEHFDQVRPRKNISTKFDRIDFLTEKNFNREKQFDCVRPRINVLTDFERGVFSTDQKTISTALDAGFSRLRSVSMQE